jgi:lipopolysaccharide export LptBFGC system permease protein LptF
LNDSLILNNNIIIKNSKDQLNINLISNERTEDNIKSYKGKENFNMIVLDREGYINNMDKEVKNGTLLNNVFTSFYITKKSLKLNKLNKNISFINKDENINEINQDMNKIKKLQLLKDKNINSISTNNFS